MTICVGGRLIRNDSSFFTYIAFDVVGEAFFSKPFGFMEKGGEIDGAIAQTLGFDCYVSIGAFVQWLRGMYYRARL